MSPVSEAALLIKKIAEPRLGGERVKEAIHRAARRLGFTPTRTKDLWYANARRIDAGEMDAIRRAAHQRRAFDAGRREARETVRRLVALRDRLAAMDADFHRPEIDALERALRAMGGDVGAGTVRDG